MNNSLIEKIPNYIEYTEKYNWNGYSNIVLQNLFLAEDFNKCINNLYQNITIINQFNNQQFFNFHKNISTFIDIIISGITNNKYVHTINNLSGFTYGIQSVKLNNILYTPNNENKYILNLGYLFPANINLVNSFNGYIDNVYGISNINNTIPSIQNNFIFDFGEIYTDVNYVSSINNKSGNCYGVNSLAFNNEYLYGEINLDEKINFLVTSNYSKSQWGIFYGLPTITNKITNESPDNELIDFEYLNNYIGDIFSFTNINSITFTNNYIKIQSNKLADFLSIYYIENNIKKYLNTTNPLFKKLNIKLNSYLQIQLTEIKTYTVQYLQFTLSY